MKSSKKVLLIIVEGLSDEELLYRRLRERFSQYNINVEVVFGGFT